MAPKEPTRAQLSSKLSYQQHTPAFLLKLQNRMAGGADEDEDDDEFEHVGNGREPIPKRPRPAIPERPADDPGSADEDDRDEGPQIVVLKEGKHLTAREVENVKRKEKGLPPLPDPETEPDNKADEDANSSKKQASSTGKSQSQGLNFSSSSKSTGSSKTAAKRKAVGQLDGIEGDEKKEGKSHGKKKAKKQNKKLLSFDDDA
ncbi:hypothetical protein EST38_g330 [Candolleomyces aberdarensis]|uniref:DUF4604 domain-containing protein n=1 Tax=Candolleomyces aberdarensis TaxID=2316362 RepID=A0A4Q2DYR2_9AGAR|nr:hypothetical protein EST38_g330 [Candolleomyces aberdarensis]